jgi:hypothetical protein
MAEECTTWTTLRCPDCDSARFVQTFGLATRANGGTVPTPHGWECCGAGDCGAPGSDCRAAPVAPALAHLRILGAQLEYVALLLEELCYQGSGRREDKAAYLRTLKGPYEGGDHG